MNVVKGKNTWEFQMNVVQEKNASFIYILGESPRVARERNYILKIITFTKLLFNISTLKQNVSSKANI